jgi:Tfp pilus assembly protein PilF
MKKGITGLAALVLGLGCSTTPGQPEVHIRQHPSYSEAHNWFRQGEYEQAIARLTQVIKDEPSNVSAYNNRGLANAGLGNYEAAIADYTSALKLSPKASIYVNRGISLNLTGKFTEAIADFTEAIMRDPNQPTPYFQRGNAYAHRATVTGSKQDRECAIKDFQKSADLDATPDAYASLGLGHMVLEHYSAAYGAIKKALDLADTGKYLSFPREMIERTCQWLKEKCANEF